LILFLVTQEAILKSKNGVEKAVQYMNTHLKGQFLEGGLHIYASFPLRALSSLSKIAFAPFT
jgi:hypothetical protein